MNQNSEVVAELREIRAELKHINQRFDEALAYQDKLAEMRFKALETKQEQQSRIIDKMRSRILSWGGAFAVLIVLSGYAFRLLT